MNEANEQTTDEFACSDVVCEDDEPGQSNLTEEQTWAQNFDRTVCGLFESTASARQDQMQYFSASFGSSGIVRGLISYQAGFYVQVDKAEGRVSYIFSRGEPGSESGAEWTELDPSTGIAPFLAGKLEEMGITREASPSA